MTSFGLPDALSKAHVHPLGNVPAIGQVLQQAPAHVLNQQCRTSFPGRGDFSILVDPSSLTSVCLSQDQGLNLCISPLWAVLGVPNTDKLLRHRVRENLGHWIVHEVTAMTQAWGQEAWTPVQGL